MKSRMKKLSWKRWLLTGGGALLVIALALYIFASAHAWNTANAATAQASSALKTSVDTKLATSTAPASTQTALDSILKSYNDSLKQGPCELSSLYEWQSNLPWLKDSRQKCLSTSKSADDLATALKNMQTFLKEEAGTAALVKGPSSVTDDTDYAAMSAAWKKVADDKSLVTDDAFKPVGVKVIDVSNAISDAYTALAAANTKQDKTAFNNASTALSAAYAQLSDVKTTANEARANLVDAVVKAYSAL